jgi:hypothetical protein
VTADSIVLLRLVMPYNALCHVVGHP